MTKRLSAPLLTALASAASLAVACPVRAGEGSAGSAQSGMTIADYLGISRPAPDFFPGLALHHATDGLGRARLIASIGQLRANLDVGAPPTLPGGSDIGNTGRTTTGTHATDPIANLSVGPVGYMQNAPAEAAPGKWVSQLATYLWFSGMSGTLNIGQRSVDVSTSFGDLFSKLSGGLIFAYEGHKDKLFTLVDFMWMNLHNNVTGKGLAFSEFGVRSTSVEFDPEIGYRVMEKSGGTMDVLAGFRYWNMSNAIIGKNPGQPDNGVSASKSWVDPVLGLRFKQLLSSQWYLTFKGDFGGFGVGSQFTWQIFGGVGYNPTKSSFLLLAYRYLSVDFGAGNFVNDFAMQGPLLGVGVRF